MEALKFFTEIDQHLNSWAQWMGPWIYVVLFLILFCETGLVVAPFLPGDSLLFAVGALAASEGSTLSLWILLPTLIIAAVTGDAVNYAVGKFIGPRIFAAESSWLFNKAHLLRASAFYEKYGGKTIILARFVPIVRTFAPFVAGIGKMNYRQFWSYNVIGGIAWVSLCLLAGYALGNIPVVKKNFEIAILVIIAISLLPMAFEFYREWQSRRQNHRHNTVDMNELK